MSFDRSYVQKIASRYARSYLGIIGATILVMFFTLAIWAPFFASGKPILCVYNGHIYFPLCRYLLSTTYFTKPLDIFYNALSIVIPFFIPLFVFSKRRFLITFVMFICTFVLWGYACFFRTIDPAISVEYNIEEQHVIDTIYKESQNMRVPRACYPLPSWSMTVRFMNEYAKLNLVISELIQRNHAKKVCSYISSCDSECSYSLYGWKQRYDEILKNADNQVTEKRGEQYQKEKAREDELRRKSQDKFDITSQKELEELTARNIAYEELENERRYIRDKEMWIEENIHNVSFLLMPIIRPFHWEEKVGGGQRANTVLPFWELTRTNRNDLVAALVFGTRISLFVGIASCALALIIGVPLGLLAGYSGSTLDIIMCRCMEVWESMPTFFMLLLLVTILQTKSIVIIIVILGVFGWTSSYKFVRAETFRQRELLYVESCRAMGYRPSKILISHILPNSILVPLALLPFDIMSAITREAGLSFLGLGEEQSCSWGVLMDEGRAVFPAESSLLWPPAIVLTILLISIAFVGEALQSAMDPKIKESIS